MASVLFYNVTAGSYESAAAHFAAMIEAGTVVSTSFYRVGTDLYLGTVKISNASDLATAVANISQNASDISDLEDAIAALDQEVITSGTAGEGQIRATGGTFATNDVEVLNGLTQVDGKITAATSTKLKKVASTGAAEDISIADEGGYLTATDVEGAIAELAQASSGGVASRTVYLQDESTGQTAYAKVYKLYQGSNSSDMTQNTLVGTINLPKDKVVESGSVVVNPTGQPAGTYIELVLQNVDEPLYINVADLVDAYTGGTTTEVTVAVSDANVITATIGEVSGSKLTDATVTKAKLASAVQASLDLADSAVQAVAEGATNGTVAVDGTDVAVHGLGSAAYTASTAYEAAGAVSTAIEALDVTDTAVNGEYVSAVSQTDGVITVTRATLPTLTWEEV